MLELDKIRFLPASKPRQPERETETVAELKQLWPKIMALNPGEGLVVPYASNGRFWVGYSYCRKLKKLFASHPAAKSRNLKVTRNANNLYILAMRDIWQPLEESWIARLGALSYVGLFCAALIHWTTVEWILGFLIGGCLWGMAGKRIEILKDHIEKLEECVEALEDRAK